MRILVIDGERYSRQTLRAWLIEQGHDVHDVSGGPQAFQLLKALRYDVVILSCPQGQYDNSTMIEDIRRAAAHARIIVSSDFATLKQDLALLEQRCGHSDLAPRLSYSGGTTGTA
jgi:DNA-binding response OmpR family regulator